MQYKDVTPTIAELVRLKNSIPLEIDVGRYLPEVRKNTHGEAVRSGLKKALRVIEQAPVVDAMPRWISVEERLPEDDANVLVYAIGNNENSCIAMTSYTHNLHGFHIEGWRSPWQYFFYEHKITHWMPLPEPPKEDSTC